MTKILIFTENYFPGGGNRYLVDLLNAFNKYYKKVVIVCNPKGLFTEDKQRIIGNVIIQEKKILTSYGLRLKFSEYNKIIRYVITMLLIIMEPLFHLYNLILFIKIIKKENPTAILCCNGGYPASRASLLMLVTGKILKKKIALSIVSLPNQRNKILIIIEILRDYIVNKYSDLIIVNANSIADSLEKTRGFDKTKINIIHNGLEKRKNINNIISNSSEIIIGCISRMDRMKGILVLIEAFYKLNNNNIKLTIAGHSGDASIEIKRKIEKLQIKNKVNIIENYIGDAEILLNKFYLFVYPSFYDGFPYCVLEAMRSGKAIIATNVGGISEAIKNEKEGLLVKPNSVPELYSAMNKILSDKDLHKILSENAKKKFNCDFTLEKMNEKVCYMLNKTKFINESEYN